MNKVLYESIGYSLEYCMSVCKQPSALHVCKNACSCYITYNSAGQFARNLRHYIKCNSFFEYHIPAWFYHQRNAQFRIPARAVDSSACPNQPEKHRSWFDRLTKTMVGKKFSEFTWHSRQQSPEHYQLKIWSHHWGILFCTQQPASHVCGAPVNVDAVI